MLQRKPNISYRAANQGMKQEVEFAENYLVFGCGLIRILFIEMKIQETTSEES
jgi:hypothetical protein